MTAEPVPIRRPDPNAEPVDLAAIAGRHPVRLVRMDMAAVLLGLSIGDMVDLETALGVPFAELTSAPRLEVLAALAWLIARREDPDLRLADVRTSWRIELAEDPTKARASRPPRRARSRSSE
jgi:hypothetical protein